MRGAEATLEPQMNARRIPCLDRRWDVLCAGDLGVPGEIGVGLAIRRARQPQV
jgi:hypothetical protein